MVDEGTTMGDLKGLLDQFAKAMYGADKKTRFRPGYYPFTEPSVAFDVECLVCGGSGCPACGRSGWMTILGAGMIHPVVLQYGGLDPERYQGFAFGMGPERIKMLKHGITDLRLFLDERPALPGAVPMKAPLSWLREFVDVDLTPEQIAERLTLLGMEVKGIVRWGDDWRNVVVGELLSVERHPRADRLSLTRVTVGAGEPLEIVCGATNIAAGQRVPVALPGAVLPGDRRIERTEKMGVVSNGMLCSGDELGLTGDADGILILPADTPLGSALTDLYGDVVFDVDVKPNRGDALSIVGLARELAAVTGGEVRLPPTEVTEAGRPTAERLQVEVRDPDLCPRFVGRWVSGVRVAPSPDRVQMRLLAAGHRPISNIVDASNYVMVELGKPIHTYDAGARPRRPDHRPPREARRAPRDTRPRRPRPRARDPAHRRPGRSDRHRRRHGQRRIGGRGGDDRGHRRVGHLRPDQHPPDGLPLRPAVRRQPALREGPGVAARAARRGPHGTSHRGVGRWRGRAGCGRHGARRSAARARRVPPGPGGPARSARASAPTSNALSWRGSASRPRRPPRARASSSPPGPSRSTVAAGEDEVIDATVPTWRRDLLVEADITEEIIRVRGYELVPTTPAGHADAALPARSARSSGRCVRETLGGRRPDRGRDVRPGRAGDGRAVPGTR